MAIAVAIAAADRRAATTGSGGGKGAPATRVARGSRLTESLESTGTGDREATVSEQVVAVVVPAQATSQDAVVAVVSPDAPTKVIQAPQPQPEPAPAENQQVAVAQPEPAAPALQFPVGPDGSVAVAAPLQAQPKS